MTERGHAAAEFALAVGVLLLPVALVIMSFGPWSEQRVFAEAAAAEAARSAVISVDVQAGVDAVRAMMSNSSLAEETVRLGWCGAAPGPLASPPGSCPLSRGSVVGAEVEVWVPLITTPWGPVGGLWVAGSHSEPLDLYRSIP